MLFYWWRKKVRKKRIISKPSDSKISPQVPPHPQKVLFLDKIPAPTFENKSPSSNCPKFIPFTTSSNRKGTCRAPATTNKPSSNSLVPNTIAKIPWTEDPRNSPTTMEPPKEKDPSSKNNNLKKDLSWKAFWTLMTSAKFTS